MPPPPFLKDYSGSLIPRPMNPSYQGNSTIYWMLIQSIYSLMEKPALDLQGIHLAGSAVRSSKAQSTILSSRRLQVCGKYG